MEIIDAAPHLEKVEGVIHELFRRNTRGKGSVINVLSRNAAEARRGRRAGEFIFQAQLDQRSEAQAQTVRIGLGERFAQNLVENES